MTLYNPKTATTCLSFLNQHILHYSHFIYAKR